jgi:Protein of unknown function (DUF3109)
MIAIDNTLVSEEILKKKFVCDLTSCKGHCCVEGESGAPLEKEELKQLEEIFPVIRDMLTPEGLESIEQQGLYLLDGDGDYVTPLVGGERECAYTIFEGGIAKCSIEKAFLENKVSFRKPVSCHLYPVRITKYEAYDAVNYEKWSVCSPACALGEQLKVPVYVFLKDSLIRKYGEDWYKQLQLAAELYEK